MTWDLLLYVPTVIALLSMGIKLWFASQSSWSYLLVFLATLFFLIGANRILKTRLMVLPGAPVALEVDKHNVTVDLRNGSQVVLIKELKFFSEVGGKTFALTGMDQSGRRQQFVFHAGQFPNAESYRNIRSALDIYR